MSELYVRLGTDAAAHLVEHSMSGVVVLEGFGGRDEEWSCAGASGEIDPIHPMSTPSAAGMIAARVAITLPTIAPGP